MEQLDRFLTCIVKDLNKRGFLDTLENYVEHIIRKGFEILTDFAILFLKDLIRKGFYFFNAGTKPNYAQNGIFDVIYELLKQFNLTDFKTICNYINAAIQLLYKLLGCKQNKTLTPNKVKEITPNEKMSMIPTKSCNSNNANIIMKADIPMNKDIYEYYGDINVNKASYIPVTQEKIAPQNGTVGVIVGTGRANNTNFKGVERKISFYVGNVSLTASEQNIIDYFKNKIPGGSFECIKLKTYCGMQSFKLTANLSSKKGLENSNNWPEGVRVRPWVRKNKMSTNTKKNTMAGRNGV